ncbi:MAG: marine proteobacterial sortase target protein [Xanthomonadales bacterium]|nr:marine proteobacterial sortase target protein [Xanthomonadales bacterium]
MKPIALPAPAIAAANAAHSIPCQRRHSLLVHTLLLAGTLLIFSTIASAQSQRPPPAPANDSQHGLQLLDAAGQWYAAMALETTVDFHIRGLIAEVTVSQRYVNDSGEWLEGRYLLPLPGDAAVGSLRLQVGERLIEGQIQEKAQAQASYQRAAAAGQVAGLVEHSRENLFRTAVANIGPGEEVVIEIGYWQAVDQADGQFGIALPLTFTPQWHFDGETRFAEQDAPVTATGAATHAVDLGEGLAPTVALNIDLAAGLPLASITSPSHAIHVEPLPDDHYRIELADLVEPGDRDFELRWTPRASSAPQQAVFTETVDGEHYALVMMVPPTLPTEPVARELILLVDTSGSMHGVAMAQAIAALEHALDRLRPDDHFNLVRFDHRSEALFGQSLPADAGNIGRARSFVAGLHANGGTHLMPALRLAFDSPPVPGHLRQVVLITDAGVGNEQELLHAIEHERGPARLFAVGIGSAPNAHFLRRAAELGQGSQVLIRELAQVDAGIDTLLRRLDQPALRDLAVRWPGAAEVWPNPLPDLYVGEPLQVVARLSALGGEVVASGQSRHQHWQQRANLLAAQPGHGVARLWAKAKITALDDALRDGADPDLIREQTLEVALRHGLVSRYTSLVAVERRQARPDHADLASMQFANAPPAGSIGYAQGATSARMRLAAAIGLVMLALLVAGRRRRSGS